MRPVLISLFIVTLFFTNCAEKKEVKEKETKKDGISKAFPPRIIPLNLSQIKIDGYIGHKIDLCIKNSIKARNEQSLVEPFRHRNETHMWQSEFWGKWFLAAAKAYQYTGDAALKKKLDAAVSGLLETQSDNGYIGNYADGAHLKQWDIWGRKYCLLGLLAYYDITQNQKVLDAAKRLTDHLMSEVGPDKINIIKTGNYRGMASSSILEPIVLLYNRTQDERYLEFAKYIVKEWETPDGPQLISKALIKEAVAKRFPPPKRWWSWENGKKAYEMMSCYDGLLELYKVTGDLRYLGAVRRVVQNIIDTEITIIGSGSSVECWYGGKSRQTEPTKHMHETCVTQTWMKLVYKLYQILETPALMDQLEITAYNAMLGALTPDGSSFAKYSPLVGTRRIGEMQCGMDLNCCIANGPRGIMMFPQFAVMKDENGPVINLYGMITSKIELPSASLVKIEQKSDYPRSGDVLIRLALQKEAQFTLSLRIPAWSKNSSVAVNGEKVNNIQPGKYLKLNRLWKDGDKISLKLDMRIRSIIEPTDHNRHIALMRGPIVLTRDRRLNNLDVDVAVTTINRNETVSDSIEAVQRDPFWLMFKIPFKIGDYLEGEYGRAKDIYFCDFSSAGNSWDKRSRYRVWLPLLLDPARVTE